jgi:hypothetical protein
MLTKTAPATDIPGKEIQPVVATPSPAAAGMANAAKSCTPKSRRDVITIKKTITSSIKPRGGDITTFFRILAKLFYEL